MSYIGGVIRDLGEDDGVIFYNVQQALGTSKNDLGQLCTHQNLRTWAKYRPIELGSALSPVLGVITDEQRRQANWGIKNIPVWSQGKNIINVASYWIEARTDGRNIPDYYPDTIRDHDEGWWEASLPQEGHGFRVTDFVSGDYPSERGYFVRASPPIGNLKYCSISSDLVTVEYDMNLDGISSGLTIWYGDIKNPSSSNLSVAGLYFGVVIYVKIGSATTVYLATQDNQVGNVNDTSITSLWSMAATVRFKIDSTSGAIYTKATSAQDNSFKIFPVFTGEHMYWGNTAITPYGSSYSTNITHIALQPAEDTTITIMALQGEIGNLRAWKKSNQQAYRCTFTLSANEKTLSHVFRVRVYFRDSSGNVLATSSPSNTSQAGYISVPAGGSWTPSSPISNVTSGAMAYDVLVVVEKADDGWDSWPYWRSISAMAVIEDDSGSDTPGGKPVPIIEPT